jgi:hypothetical protein
MPEPTHVRLTELADRFPVDTKTMAKACRKAGVRVVWLGHCRYVAKEDAEAILRDGIPYYTETIRSDYADKNNHR